MISVTLTGRSSNKLSRARRNPSEVGANEDATGRRFTTYERSLTTGLDYAVNRHYDPRQGRFTQVDPIGIRAANPAAPQTWNMYSYCGNDPINNADPDGLFIGSILRWAGRFLVGLFGGPGGVNVNASFAYKNLPPISVSFQNNFQSTHIGFAGVYFQIAGGQQTGSQNPYPSPPSDCEEQLANLFGDPKGKPGARMIITTDISTNEYRGYDPTVPASANPDMQHLYFYPHLTSPDGSVRTPVFVPNDFKYLRRMVLLPENGPIRLFYSARRDVTIFILHLANFRVTRAGDRFLVGYTGGIGGSAPGNLHVHFAVHKGRGYNPAKRVPFPTVFCK